LFTYELFFVDTGSAQVYLKVNSPRKIGRPVGMRQFLTLGGCRLTIFDGDASRGPRGVLAGSRDASGRTYTIGQLASELGVTQRAIRFYESRGLLAPARSGTARVYGHRDRVRLVLILRGKRMGFSLKEIQEFLDLYVVDATKVTQLRSLLDKVRVRIAMLEAQLQDVQTSLTELRDMERLTRVVLTTKEIEMA